MRLFEAAGGSRFKTDDVALNLCLLSLQLDFGLYEDHAGLLNLPFLQSLSDESRSDKRQLQVRITTLTTLPVHSVQYSRARRIHRTHTVLTPYSHRTQTTQTVLRLAG
jgi:hypothetical protein